MPRFLTLFILALVTSLSASAATTVAQRLLRADGTAYTGKFKISWPTYTNASGAIVRAGYSTVTLESDGDFTVSLAPHINSPASGPIYTVDYNELKQGTRQTEYWDVPDTVSTLDIADVLTVAPASTPSSIASLPSLSVVGTITTGVWNATAIAAQYGGTGDNTSATTGIPYISAGNWQYNSDVSNTELGYLDNVTSAIQTQIDAKLPLAGGTITGQVDFVPASGTYAADLQKSGSAGTLRIYDQTATTGVTVATIRQGAGQNATPFEIQNSAGTVKIYSDYTDFSIFAEGGFKDNNSPSTFALSNTNSGLALGSGKGIAWSSDTTFFGAKDTGLFRNAAGIVEVNNGTPGAFAKLKALGGITTAVTAYDSDLANSTCAMPILTSNTNLQLRCKGSDGTVRFADLTLAP